MCRAMLVLNAENKGRNALSERLLGGGGVRFVMVWHWRVETAQYVKVRLRQALPISHLTRPSCLRSTLITTPFSERYIKHKTNCCTDTFRGTRSVKYFD